MQSQSCVYSAQGNLVCGNQNPSRDPMLTVAQTRCSSHNVEQFVDSTNLDWQSAIDSLKRGVGKLTGRGQENFVSEDTAASMQSHTSSFLESAKNAVDNTLHWPKRKPKETFVEPSPVSTAMNLSYSVSPWPF